MSDEPSSLDDDYPYLLGIPVEQPGGGDWKFTAILVAVGVAIAAAAMIIGNAQRQALEPAPAAQKPSK